MQMYDREWENHASWPYQNFSSRILQGKSNLASDISEPCGSESFQQGSSHSCAKLERRALKNSALVEQEK